MIINDKEVNIDDLLNMNFEDKMKKKRNNGLYLSEEDISVLNKYGINYLKYNNVKSLIFDIEEILNEESDLDDLDRLSESLQEYSYYNETNK